MAGKGAVAELVEDRCSDEDIKVLNLSRDWPVNARSEYKRVLEY